MNDSIGQEVEVGDMVVFSSYIGPRSICKIGTVFRIYDDTVHINSDIGLVPGKQEMIFKITQQIEHAGEISPELFI